MVDGGWGVWVAIALGSAAGGVLRQLVTELTTRVAGGGFPAGTLLVNVSGSAAMGMAAALALGVGGAPAWSPVTRHAVMTGLLGGFTTFSAFSMQTVALAGQGEWPAAAVNVVASVVSCLAACWTGYAAVAALVR
ncbi:MAG: CrcB family protein [Vicinamibacterales bacterium]